MTTDGDMFETLHDVFGVLCYSGLIHGEPHSRLGQNLLGIRGKHVCLCTAVVKGSNTILPTEEFFVNF